MNDIKGLHRGFEDGAEPDDQMMRLNPRAPPRKGSLSRGMPSFETSSTLDLNGKMNRSNSALDIERYQFDGIIDNKTEKKRGRSPFKFFKKSRDQSKDKHKSKSPTDRGRGRGVSGKFSELN